VNKTSFKSIFVVAPLIIFFSLSLDAEQAPDAADNQKQEIDRMHHQLHDDQAPYKEKEAQALKELNEMTIRDDVRLEDIYAKIDELMYAKTHIMRLRYEHLVEMRQILTDEQRVNYDRNVLNRSEVR